MSDGTEAELAAFTDGRLAELVQRGDTEAFAELTARYAPMIRAKAQPFRAAGAETDDLCQEGLLGLLRAAQTYEPRRGASFRTYAGVCVTNRILTACRAAAARRNDPMSDFVSLSGEDAPELPADCSADPEALLDDRENLRFLHRRIAETLTPMELRVLRLYLGGCTYREIARKMSVTEKAADNALQRARVKLKHAGRR